MILAGELSARSAGRPFISRGGLIPQPAGPQPYSDRSAPGRRPKPYHPRPQGPKSASPGLRRAQGFGAALSSEPHFIFVILTGTHEKECYFAATELQTGPNFIQSDQSRLGCVHSILFGL